MLHIKREKNNERELCKKGKVSWEKVRGRRIDVEGLDHQLLNLTNGTQRRNYLIIALIKKCTHFGTKGKIFFFISFIY